MRMPLNPLAMELGIPLAEAGVTTPNRRSAAYVGWVQSSLNRIMRAGLTVDGRIGARTRGAVQAFQRQRGLVADGVVGPATERALIAAGAPPLAMGGQGPAPLSTPTPVPTQTAPVSAPLVATDLAALASPAIQPTAANIVAIMRAISRLHNIPFALGLTVLDHECPGDLARGFRHSDGLMQTIRSARTSIMPRIPRPLARLLLGLPPDARVDDSELNRRLHAEFSRRVAVQIAAGVQEIVEGLRAFNGYVAPALIAYNAGKGNAAYIVTQGRAKRRPAGTSDASWESMCRLGAAMLHQPPSAVNVAPGRWRCDMNIPAWHREFQIRDKPTGLLLIAYQYLRSVPACIREQRPLEACTAATHTQRREGSGKEKCTATRAGVLDKLYEPRRLRRALFDAAGGALSSITDDARPLRVEAGQFVKAPLASQVSP